LQSVSGRLPVKGEKIESAGWCFEITGLDGKRIETVLASRKTPLA